MPQMTEKKNEVKKMAKKLEKDLSMGKILNLKYIDQNFHMKKEISRYESIMEQKIDKEKAKEQIVDDKINSKLDTNSEKINDKATKEDKAKENIEDKKNETNDNKDCL